jgi:hypothetical protein
MSTDIRGSGKSGKSIARPAAGGSLARRLLSRMPGGDFVQEQIDNVERRLLQELKQRMEGLQPPPVSVVAVAVQAPRSGHAAEPGDLLRGLLEASAEQSREEAETSLYVSILRSLVPDEARILSALSDGSSYPLIHVLAASRLGLAWHPVLECASTVGKSAGVLWPDVTHVYVQHLRSWGLVEAGPEDEAQLTRYQILETETAVRAALEQIRQGGQRSQIARRMLKISELGSQLWAACRISQD